MALPVMGAVGILRLLAVMSPAVVILAFVANAEPTERPPVPMTLTAVATTSPESRIAQTGEAALLLTT